MKTFTVDVTQRVNVTLDETKFDEAFLAEFRENMYDFDTVEEHAEHLAQLYARGLVDDFGSRFIEGYGPAAEMGIDFHPVRDDCYQEIVPEHRAVRF